MPRKSSICPGHQRGWRRQTRIHCYDETTNARYQYVVFRRAGGATRVVFKTNIRLSPAKTCQCSTDGQPTAVAGKFNGVGRSNDLIPFVTIVCINAFSDLCRWFLVQWLLRSIVLVLLHTFIFSNSFLPVAGLVPCVSTSHSNHQPTYKHE